MTPPKAAKLTAEQLERFREQHPEGEDSTCEACQLLAHIAALEGELDRVVARLAKTFKERDALQAALREVVRYLIQRQPMITYVWSEPTARVLKELGL